jgi:type IV pilus assembly protein PilX
MMKSGRSMRTGPQQGAALIVSLIMLLLMTIVGISSVRNTAMQERMAGNLRARSLAFEHAEQGLRDAEQVAAANDNNASLFLSNNSDGAYDGRWFDAGLSQPRWQAGGFWKDGDADGDGSDDYEYIIERLDQVPLFDGCELDATNQSQCLRRMYLVTVRASVSNTGATVILQSTYKVP